MFDWDEQIDTVIRTISNIIYSKTNRCWYVDDNEDSLKGIIRALKDIADIDISAISESHKYIDLSQSAPGKYDQEAELPSGLDEVSVNREEWFDIIPQERQITRVIRRPKFSPVEFRINENDGRLAISFTGNYNQEWIDEIKSFGKFYYDKMRKEFLLPWSAMVVDSLSDYFLSCGVEVKVIKSVVSEDLKQLRKGLVDEIRGRELGDKAIEALELTRSHLDELRFSKRTNESYLSHLEFFFKYFHTKDPDRISGKEVSHFLSDFIVNNGYSASYQNIMISAIKHYYNISGTGKLNFQVFERPRGSRALPKVFSKDEVRRILNATRNNKHKLLLWMIYSCGLRRSEVTNILLTDLDRDRGVLHIREGKGRVDRIVPVSEKVWEKLDEYVDGFCPVEYLFEGQDGGRYSVESVYRVFKQALWKAGIRKDVGVHSLRHSYATHLHESGLDIRYIQELLGHRITRTTEIYTHVSRRNLVAIRSPIEDLDVK
jgi:integrase/recombinase XerD